jgi:hypothetical protein
MITYICPICKGENYDYEDDFLGDDLMGDIVRHEICEQCDRYDDFIKEVE